MIRRHAYKIRRAFAIEHFERRMFLSGVFYVDANAPAGAQDGASWGSAFMDLQAAIAAASVGDEIRVANGTYKPTSDADRDISFQLYSGLGLFGGYAGFGAANPDARDVAVNVTILSGEIGNPSLKTDNSRTIVDGTYTDETASFDGFTIRDSYDERGNGGGMYTYGGSPTVRNCTFTANAAFSGAGMYNDGASPHISNCSFIANSSDVTESGGGMTNAWGSEPTIADCVFANNALTGLDGGGGAGVCNSGSSPRITRCTFAGNSTLHSGSGAAMVNAGGAPIITDCVFSNNSIQGNGRGAGITNGSHSSPIITNCTFSRNSIGGASSFGGGMYNTESVPTVSNCTFTGNTLGPNGQGAGMYNYFYSSPTITSCTFTRNSIASGGKGGGMANYVRTTATIRDCAFNGNSTGAGGSGGAIYIDYESSPTVTNCVMVGNSSSPSGKGGGVYSYTSAPQLTNCTVVANIAGYGGAFYTEYNTPTLTNCILWANTAPNGAQFYQVSTTPTVTFCDVQGTFPGMANINADPQFVRNPSAGVDNAWGTSDDDYGDLHLKATSPCVDAGQSTAVPADVSLDIEGNDRVVDVPGVRDPGAKVDMGAYERQVPLYAKSGWLYVGGASPAAVVRFNLPLSQTSISATDLTVRTILGNGALGGTIAPVSFNYDAASRSVSFALPINLADGNYRATIAAGGVNDSEGVPIGSASTFDFFFFAGDANQDRKVDIADLAALAMNWRGAGKVFSQGDLNFDGTVDSVDLGILASRWQQNLAPPTAASPVSVLSTPIRRPVRMIAVVS